MLWVRRIIATIGALVQTAWLNRNLDSESRAAVVPMTGRAISIDHGTGGPAFGLIASTVSMQVALLASAVVLSPIVAVYRLLTFRDRDSIELVLTTAD